jgi:hypothetical protein
MKRLEKFEAEIIAFALSAIVVMVIAATFVMVAHAQPQHKNCAPPNCYYITVIDRNGQQHLVWHCDPPVCW